MAVTNFPATTEMAIFEGSTYDAGTNIATGVMVAANESPISSSKMRTLITAAQQATEFLQDPSPQLPLEDWTAATLQNSWVNWNVATHHPAEFVKDSNGFVTIHGLIKDGTRPTGTNKVLLFTLPVGYRPTKDEIFLGIDIDQVHQIEVQADGKVMLSRIQNFTGSNYWVSLTGIRFATT